MRNLILIIASVVCISILFFVLSQSNQENNNDEFIVIGATLPLSGDAAVWGKNTQEGIELAINEINATGGVLGRKLKVIYEDTRALPKDGVSAYRKLTTIHKVQAIIDDSVSSVTLAMAPLAERDQVVILSTGATAPKISDAGEYIFRIWNSDSYEGEIMADYAFEVLGLRSISILYINNEYGKGLEQVFVNYFLENGGEIISTESFSQGSTNIRSQLVKIQNSKPEGIYLVGYPKEIPIALKQAKELGLKQIILGTVAMQDPQLIQSAGNAADGLIFPFPKEPSGNQVTTFKTSFYKRYNKEPGITADVGYDAVKMLAVAIEKKGEYTGEQVRQGLNSLKNFPGASGTMTFDKNGDVQKPMGMKKVVDENFVWID